MTTLQNGDSFLVQRSDSQSGISTNYQVSQENLMANLADDDLLLVQRTSAGISTNYSITGSALKEDLSATTGLIRPPVAVLTPLNGSGITEFTQYEPLSSAITAVGEAGTITKNTDNILSVVDEAPIVSWDIADGSSPSFVNTDINFATELAAKGVTAITGINLYLDDVSGYPYTSNLGGFTLNNVDLVGAAQVSLISYNGTPYNSNYSWVSFFNGGGYNQCQGSTTYTCLFHPRSLGTVAKLKVLSVGGRVSLLDQDGAEHFIIGSSGKKVLSFPTNTNFSGLSVGDVVQGNPLNGTASVTQGYTFTDGRGNLDNLFNGVVTGNGTASSDYLNHLVQPNDAGGLPCTLTFDPPLSARSGTLKAYVTRYSAGNVNYTINGSAGHSVYAASNPVEDDTGVTSISTFTFDSNTGNAQLWGFSDGEGVLQHVDNVTVTAIDATAPSQQQADVYATWDPSKNPGNNTLSNGNLTITTPSSGISATGGTIAVSSGKWYYEFEVTNGGATSVGVIKTSDSLSGFLGGTSGAYAYYSESGYVKKINNNARTNYGEYYSTGDTIGVALDLDAGTITFYKNGVSQGQAFSGLSGTFIPAVGDGTSQSGITGTANFGATPFTYTPPSGHVGLSETVTIYTYPSVTVDGGDWDASNQSQTWSNLASVTTGTAMSGRGLDRLFNGIVNNDDPPTDAFFESDGNPMTVTFSSPITATSSIKMWIGAYYAQTTGQLYVNGNNFDVSNVPSNNNDPILVDLGVTSLTSFGSRSNQTIRFIGLVVDGRLLVDPYEDSQVWSNGTYTGTAANNNYGVTDLFANVGKSGDAFGANKLWGLHQATATFTLDNPIPLTSNSTLELITYQSSSSSGSITLTGSGGSLVPTLTINGGNVLGKTTVSNPYASLGDSITAITIAASGADWTGLEGIIVDGKPVIDAGIRNLGDKKINSSTPYEKSLTFTDVTELANMVAPLEMVDATGSNSLTPTTSIVDSTTVIPPENLFNSRQVFHYSGDTLYNTGISGNRMVWFKNYGSHYSVISDSVNFDGQYIPTGGDTKTPQSNGITFNADSFNDGGLLGASGSDHAFFFDLAETAEVFDIVNYTGDGSSSNVISHNLGVEPGMIIIKAINENFDWVVWHKDLNPTQGLALNLSHGQDLVGAKVTAVSSESFTVNTVWAANKPDTNFVAYVFGADTAGKVKCGTYEGNSGYQLINMGFQPGFVLIKNIDVSYNWAAATEETMEWSTGAWWRPDNNDALQTGGYFTQAGNGLNLNGNKGEWNISGNTFVYLAIANDLATSPKIQLNFQDSTDLNKLTSGMTVTSNAASTGLSFSTTIYSGNSTHTGSGAEQVITTGIDNTQKSMIWFKNRSGSSDHKIFDTLRTPPDHRWLTPNKNWDELDGAAVLKDRTTSGFTVVHPTSGSGVAATNPNDNEPDMVAWNFRAEPGFFDIVTWDGNGTNREIAHNLGSVPGFIIIKRYTANEDWTCYHKSLGATNYMQLNGTDRSTSFSLIFNDTEPTSTHFTVGTHDRVNTTGQSYIAYVFADNPSKGIKCGVYSGNSSAQTIDTGFETGWVMVKQSTNDYRDWTIVDNVRGGGSGNTGKQLAANGDGPESGTNLDFVSTGFELFDGSSEVNTSGEDYIYIAIAANPILLGAQATASLTADANTSTNTAILDTPAWPTGDSVSGPSVSASLTTILEVSGNTIFGNGPAGTWMSGYYAEGSQVNAAPPAPSEVTFTSTDNGTTPVSMIDATLSTRTWTLESGTTATGPWTLVDSYSDFDAIDSQDGATPWTTTKPTLQPNTYYRIKVRYDSLNADSVESVFNTFKTGDA